jgi:beta-glucosidase
MTPDEKQALVHGTRDPRDLGQAGYWPGVPRLGIPPLRFADGPPGINANRSSTAMPAPVALAATFDIEAARQYGIVLGSEAAALAQNVVLGPHVNIVRDPLFRRNHTAFSEDPLVSALIGAAEIRGIQSQGVMAQVKHLAGYNGAQEVAIDKRALRDMYLVPFAAAVEAGVASVMCAYNKINGDWACANGALQNDILRGDLGFRGFITSDWGATHSAEDIQRGLDLEMPGREIHGRPGGPYFTGPLPPDAVDRAVRRILEQMNRFGMLKRKPAGPRPIDVEAGARAARAVATQGAVLLRNAANALPLGPHDLASLVFIGPTAGQLAAGYLGERGYGFESRLVSPLAAMRRTSHVEYSPGVDLTGSTIVASGTRLEFNSIAPDSDFQWSGTLNIEEEGDYTFLVQPKLGQGSEGSGTLMIDGKRAARTGGPGFGGTGVKAKKWSGIVPTTDGRDNGIGAAVHLTRGPHRIDLTANSTGEGPLSIRYAWITPQARRSAIDAATRSAAGKTAVVFAWAGTGMIDLPEQQNELIARIAGVARKTIVVLNTGGPVLMPWKDKASSILEMWYPGQEGGWATIDFLLGRANPSGKLPVTFPRRLEDTAPYAPGHPERTAPQAIYSEGLAVGYRWFDQERIEPLFAFGHGLSYTTFEYSDLKVDGATVSVTLRNTGRRRGAEVVQVYVGEPHVLRAFTRVELAPGEFRRVSLDLDRYAWLPARTGRRVFVGGLTGATEQDSRITR